VRGIGACDVFADLAKRTVRARSNWEGISAI
jgi:hypothetical protein